MSRSHFFRQLVILITLCSCVIPALTYCSEDSEIEALPDRIQRFISKYYPEISVSDYTFNEGIYGVSLHNSAYLSFDSSMEWISVDGRGSTLPLMFLFDEMPEPVYQFLESTESLDRVYSTTRDTTAFHLHLKDQDIVYEISTGRITTVP